MNFTRIVDIMKDMKIGQRLKFLPRKLTDLQKNLQTLLLEELIDIGKSEVWVKLVALLKELLQCNGNLQEQYTTIKDNNIQ